MLISSCNSDSSISPDKNDGSFTPPTTYYYKVDGKTHVESMDAPKISQTSAELRFTKRFNMSNEESVICRLQTLNATNSTIAFDLAEGAVKILYISEFNTSNSLDSVKLSLEVDNYPTGIYDLKAKTGKIYVNKKNGILRITSDGVLTLTGLNNLAPKEAQTRTLDFSVENGKPF